MLYNVVLKEVDTMGFFNVIFTITNEVTDSIAKWAQLITEGFPKLSTKNKNTSYNQHVNESDKEKIAGDFRRIGKDMYVALDRYEATHG